MVTEEYITTDEDLLQELKTLIGIIQLAGGTASLFMLGINVFGLVRVLGRTAVYLNIYGTGYMFSDASQFSVITYTIPFSLFGKDYRYWQTVADTVSGTVEIPDGVVSIASNFLRNEDFITNMHTVVIGKDVKYIGDSAFDISFSDLKTVIISEEAEILSLGKRAFAGNTNLETINFNGTVKYVGRECFSNCQKVKYLNLSTEIYTLSGSTFENCYELIRFNIYNQVNYLDQSAFNNGCFKNCIRLTDISFADTVYFPMDDKYMGELMKVDLYSGLDYDDEGYTYTHIYLLNNKDALSRNWKKYDNRHVIFETPTYEVIVNHPDGWIEIPVEFNLSSSIPALDINVGEAYGKIRIFEDHGDKRHVCFLGEDKWYWLNEK